MESFLNKTLTHSTYAKVIENIDTQEMCENWNNKN